MCVLPLFFGMIVVVLRKDPPKLFGINPKGAKFMYMIHKEINMIDLNIFLKL